MRTTFAEGLLSALIYCQVLLLFAGVASVLLRDRSEGDFARHVEMHASSDAQASL